VENHYRFQVVVHDTDEPTLKAQVLPYNVPGFSDEYSANLHAYWVAYKARETARGPLAAKSLELRIREDDARFRVSEAINGISKTAPDDIRAWRATLASALAGNGPEIRAALDALDGEGVDTTSLRNKASALWPADFTP
jgi:hypothetical protein